jgi:hypothetical protein
MILYEVACFMRGTRDGRVRVTHPQLAEAIQAAGQ